MTGGVDELGAALTDLRRGAESWARTDYRARLPHLRRCLDGVAATMTAWVDTCCADKHAGLRPEDAERVAGEEIGAGPVATARYLRLLMATHRHLAAGRLPPLPGARTREGVPVFPTREMLDRRLYTGYSAIVRVAATGPLQAPPPLGRPEVCVVLGAGNVSSIPLTDLLHQVFVESRAVLLKPGPTHDALVPVFERVLAPLIELDVVRVVPGDAGAGAAIVQHDLVDAVHLTGSQRTAAAVQSTIGARTFTSELGNASPVLVLPGRFSTTGLRAHAENIATMLVNNASCNCVAAQLLVTWRDWPQRTAFLDAIDSVLESLPAREGWFPGTGDRFARFCPGRATGDGGRIPWTLVRDVDPGAGSGHPSPFVREELFAGALAEIALAAPSGEAFQPAAVRFLNDEVWGCLGATVIAPQDADPGHALHDLRYGTVALNQWCALAYAWMSPPWGGYPGGESGSGFVHNSYLLAAPEKTIVRGPFRPRPKPVWFATHRHGTASLRALARLYSDGRLRHVPAVLWHAMRS